MTLWHWWIDPGSWRLEGNGPWVMWADELAEQHWPECPRCAQPVSVNRRNVTDPEDRHPAYLVAGWYCRGCGVGEIR